MPHTQTSSRVRSIYNTQHVRDSQSETLGVCPDIPESYRRVTSAPIITVFTLFF